MYVGESSTIRNTKYKASFFFVFEARTLLRWGAQGSRVMIFTPWGNGCVWSRVNACTEQNNAGRG